VEVEVAEVEQVVLEVVVVVPEVLVPRTPGGPMLAAQRTTVPPLSLIPENLLQEFVL